MRTRTPRSRALGSPVPIGIPAVFVADLLEEAAPSASDLSRGHALLSEYFGASGYVFRWGHIIVDEFVAVTVWRVVPVRIWEGLCVDHPDIPARVPELLRLLAPVVRAMVEPHLPRGLVLAGLQREGRRARHALLALLLTDPAARPRVHRWLERRFVPELLPPLLRRSTAALEARLSGVQTHVYQATSPLLRRLAAATERSGGTSMHRSTP